MEERKMTKLSSLLRVLITGSFSLLIVACYGAPIDYSGRDIDVRAKDKNNQGIEGLELSAYLGGTLKQKTTTDSNGIAVITNTTNSQYTLITKDVDGTNNGGPYSDQTNTAYSGDTVEVIMQ